MPQKFIVLAALLLASSSASARNGGGDGFGLLALSLAGVVGWIGSRLLGVFAGFLLGLAMFAICLLFAKFIAAAFGALLVIWLLHGIFVKKGD